jgi:type I restriction enzyme S subunit
MSAEERTELLPKGWKEAMLGDVCKVVSGSTPKTNVSEYWGGEIPWLTPNDLSKNRSKFVLGGERFITQSGFDSCSTQMVPEGAILFTSRAPIGYVAIAGVSMCTNQGFKSAIPGDEIGSEFLYWQLQNLTEDIRSRASGTTFLEISGKGFAATKVHVPPLAEQNKIVEILEEQLSRLDAALASVRAVREKSARFRRSLLHAAFTGAITGHGTKEGAPPTGWKEAVLGDVCKVVSGSTPKTNVSEYWGGEIPWLTPNDLSKNRSKFVLGGERFITQDGFDSCSTQMVPEGAVLFTSRAPIGYVAIAGAPMCTNQGFKSAIPGDEISSGFLYWQLQNLTEDIRSRASGTTFLEISGKGFAATKIVLPSLSEQERIVEILEEQFSRLDASLAIADVIEKKASALRRSLLHAAFSGNLTKEWREGADV